MENKNDCFGVVSRQRQNDSGSPFSPWLKMSVAGTAVRFTIKIHLTRRCFNLINYADYISTFLNRNERKKKKQKMVRISPDYRFGVD